jgi:hypothetical protein
MSSQHKDCVAAYRECARWVVTLANAGASPALLLRAVHLRHALRREIIRLRVRRHLKKRPRVKKLAPRADFDKRAYAVGLARTNYLLSKKEIAERVGVDPGTISRWPEVEEAIIAQKRERAGILKRPHHAPDLDMD